MKILYGVLVCALSALLYAEWRVFPIEAPAHAAQPTPGTIVSGMSPGFLFRLRSQNTYSIIMRRPLFSESRRPEELTPPEPVVVPQEEEQPLDGLALNTVLITKTRNVALVKDPKAGSTVRLSQGDKIRGWTVTAIRPEGIDLLSPNGRTVPLDLRVFGPQPAPPPIDPRQQGRFGGPGMPPMSPPTPFTQSTPRVPYRMLNH